MTLSLQYTRQILDHMESDGILFGVGTGKGRMYTLSEYRGLAEEHA